MDACVTVSMEGRREARATLTLTAVEGEEARKRA